MKNSNFWFDEDVSTTPHQKLFAVFAKIKNRQGYRHLEFQNYMRLYGQADLFAGTSLFDNLIFTNARPQINIVQICCNTLVSKIGKTAPKATFLTEEGDIKKQKQAKKLTSFSSGQFYKSNTYQQTKRALLDASLFGTGLVKNYIKEGEIVSERVMPLEIWVDDKDAIYGSPRCIYQEKLISKEVLKASYPEFEKQIEECESAQNPFGMTGVMLGEAEMVSVVEAWHLPSSKNAKDGRHFIGIETATFYFEEFKRDYFPFSKLPYQEAVAGWWADGVAKLIMGIQMDLNKAILRASQSVNIMAVPRVLYEVTSKIVKSHFNNDVGSMIGYSGTPPIFSSPVSIAPDLIQYIQFLIGRAFQEVGISELSASSVKPAGLNSQVALREYNDIETERFASFAKNWEDFHMDIARQQIDLAKEIAETDKNYSVLARNKDGVQRLKWSEVNLSDDSYIMQVYPTSLLGHTPAGRLDRVSDLISLQLVSPEEASTLLDFPDVENIMSYKNAAFDDILNTIEMLLDGQYMSPEPFQNLALGIKYVQSAYLKYRTSGVSEEDLQLLRRWIDEAMMLMSPPDAAPDATQAAMPAPQDPTQAQPANSQPTPGAM